MEESGTNLEDIRAEKKWDKGWRKEARGWGGTDLNVLRFAWYSAAQICLKIGTTCYLNSPFSYVCFEENILLLA